MVRKTITPLLLFVWIFGVSGVIAQTPKSDPVTLANPLVGPDPFHGATAAGAARPFPLVRLGPDTSKPSTSGYNSAEPIVGFSHTHLSGAGGIGYYGNIRFTPQTGAVDVVNLASPKADEANQPGFYRVRLSRYDVGVELTSTARAGVHRYTYPQGATPRVLIDLASVVNTQCPTVAPSSICTAATGSFVSDRRIEGQASFESDFGKFPHTVYFAAQFSRPVTERAAWLENDVKPNAESVQSARGQRSGLIATFAPGGAPVEARVGISFLSIENARKHLAPTLDRSFDDIKRESQQVWRDALGKIEVQGGGDKERRQFYSALYHTQLMPTDLTDDHGLWETTEPHFDDVHAVWDTFRCTYALDTLIAPETLRRILRSQLDIYKNRGWLADYWRGRQYNIIQGGTNMDVVIADALVKNLGGFDKALAYEAVKKDATVPVAKRRWPLFGRHAAYFEKGYLPAASITQRDYMSPVSVTLEYAYDDFCVAQAAHALGHDEDAKRLLVRSQNTWNLFQPDTKFFWAKNDAGAWIEGFDPDRYTGGDGLFYEGTAWGYRFFAPHDMAGLIKRYGGRAPFVAALDTYFDTGKHNAGNEPNFLTPYLYIYAGRPDKVADRVRAQLITSYKLAPAAYSGDDDSGAMSAWYVWSAMGFYPVTGQDVYLLNSPLFASTRLKLENGRVLTLTARNLSDKNRYVQSVTCNGRPWDKAWFRHADIANGADFVLQMGPRPSKWGTQVPPPSRQLSAAVRTPATPNAQKRPVASDPKQKPF